MIARPLLRVAVPLLSLALVAGCATAETSRAPSPASSGAPSAAVSEPATSPAASTSDAALVDIPGTHLRIAPPDGFAVAKRFSGLEHANGSSVTLTELATSYEVLLPQLTDGAFSSQGISIESREAVTLPDGSAATLLKGTQTADVPLRKSLLVTGGPNLTGLVAANVPASEPAIMDAVIASLRTLEFDPDRVVDPTQALSFELTPSPPLVLAGVVGNAAAYNVSGKLPSADPSEPILIAAPSLGAIPNGDLEAFARTRIAQTPNLTVGEVESAKPVTIGGLTGVELVAPATDSSGQKIVLIHTMLADDIGYVLVGGQCREADRETCLPAIRSSTATFHYK